MRKLIRKFNESFDGKKANNAKSGRSIAIGLVAIGIIPLNFGGLYGMAFGTVYLTGLFFMRFIWIVMNGEI